MNPNAQNSQPDTKVPEQPETPKPATLLDLTYDLASKTTVEEQNRLMVLYQKRVDRLKKSPVTS